MEDSDSSSNSKSYKALVTRNITLTAIRGFSGGLEVIYYKTCLGMSAISLGYLSSVSSSIVLSSILICGWLGDRYGRKKAFVIGSLLSNLSYLLLFLADDWYWVVMACILSALGSSLVAPALEYLLGTLTKEESRCASIATMSVLVNIVNIVVPPLGAYIISSLGGVPLIRYMFLVQFMASMIVLIFVIKKLEVRENPGNEHTNSNPFKAFVRDMVELRKLLESPNAKVIVQVVIVSALAWSLPGPYWRLYVYEVCKMPIYLMGLLATAQSLAYSILSIPVSKKADRGSKKNVIIKLRVFYWLSVTSLLIAGTIRTPYNYFIPIIAWALWGVGATISSAWRSLAIESVPKDYLARWNSIRNFSYYLVAIPCYLVSGYLWNIDPRLPFTLALLMDFAMTLTLLPRISERTTKLRKTEAL